MYKRFLAAMSLTLLMPTAAFAGCGGQGQACLSWTEAPRATAPVYVNPYVQPPVRAHAYSQSQVHIPGLSAGERLCPTSCAVNVYNPEGGKVLDCYKICQTATVQPVYVAQPQYKIVRVVHPVVYVQPRVIYKQGNGCAPRCISSHYRY